MLSWARPVFSESRSHTHTHVQFPQSCIKPDEGTSQDNCWFSQGVYLFVQCEWVIKYAIPDGLVVCAGVYRDP